MSLKVSVIITVYNLEKYIRSSIDSVLNQTYKNIELLIVDDCSTDNSAEIIKEYKNINYIKPTKNGGVLLATHLGIKNATGDILTFLDGDDTWMPDKLESVVTQFEKNPEVILVSHDYEYIDSEGKPLKTSDNTQKQLQSLSTGKNLDEVSELMKKSVVEYLGYVWLGSAYSIRSSALNKDRLQSFINNLPDARNTYQDHPLATFLITTNEDNKRLSYVNRKLHQYRLHPDNYSGGNLDYERAINRINKGIHTTQATISLIENGPPKYHYTLKRQKLKVQSFQFIKDLYDRKYFKALKKYYNLALNYWDTKESTKEMIRFLSIIVLGKNNFFRLKNKS